MHEYKKRFLSKQLELIEEIVDLMIEFDGIVDTRARLEKLIDSLVDTRARLRKLLEGNEDE